MRVTCFLAFALALLPAAAHADAAATTICAQLSTDAAPVCVAAENGADAAWTQAAARFDGDPRRSIVTVWAQPGVSIDDLARNKDGALVALVAQTKLVKAYVETKNVPTAMASLQKGLALMEAIRKRQDELRAR